MHRLTSMLVPFALTPLLVLTLISAISRTLLLPTETFSKPNLTFTDRIACQRAIEEVYWQHRIWPAENPEPKPPLEVVLADEVIEARAEDAMRHSDALATLWQQPITGEMLQAEMERMAVESRNPELLAALWAALDNDPARVAECLVRPALAARLIESGYGYDVRFHGALEAEARERLANVESVADLRELGGEYTETSWALGDLAAAAPDANLLVLDEQEWTAGQNQLAAWFGVTAEGLPTGQISPLQEDEGGFFAVAVLRLSDHEMTVATVRWSKTPFRTWWSSVQTTYSTDIALPVFEYDLPGIRATRGGTAWHPTPSLPLQTNTSGVWTGTEMIVWGGGTLGAGRSNDGWAYNPATDRWVPISAVNAPEGRFGHSAVWTGTEMIVWGGCGPRKFVLCERADGGRYNPVTGVWTSTALTNVPTERLRHTAVWTGSEMVVWGGCEPISDANCAELAGGGRYDPATDSWADTSLTNAPEARTHHTALWTGDEMIVWGGDDGVSRLNSGGRYDPATDTWTPTSTVGVPSPRDDHTAVWTGGEMVVWGGCPDGAGCIVQGTPVGDGARYDPATDSWSPVSDSGAPSPRTGHSAVWTGSEMIVWGGGTSTAIYFGDGARYDPATDTWSPTSLAGAPSPRASHIAIWTGNLMLIWGGGSVTGGRYDPDTDSWTPTNTEDPDSIRAEHTAVWTGVEMIAWGGNDVPNGTVDTGVIYNPATLEWRDIADSNLGGRYGTTAFWNGTDMMVWGGAAGNFLYDNGGRYNPMSDSWTPITTTGAPEARAYHVTVWSGSEMIVWGGNGNNGILNNGGRYNPVTDSWTPTSQTNAPEVRRLMDAVWAGDEMIVWGGTNFNTGALDSGGRYDPVTDSWQATSTVNAPDPRYYQVAVWTGEVMIVWGGRASSSGPHFNSGGRYDPDADSWQAISMAGAPSARIRHTAVWTGNEMIVWGGCESPGCDDVTQTGGHYDPIGDTWTPTIVDAMTPRMRGVHSAVWTGQRMIVWGGLTDAGGYANTGAEYSVDTPSNNAPTVTEDEYDVGASSTLTVPAPGVLTNDSDPDGNTMTSVVVSAPAHGALVLNGDGGFNYQPEPGYSGSDLFTYRVWDGMGYSGNANVTITIGPPGGTPTPTSAPPTATATGLPPTATGTIVPPTATGVPPTATGSPPTGTPVPTGSVTTVPPPATPSATAGPQTVTPTTPPTDGFQLLLPLVLHQ